MTVAINAPLLFSRLYSLSWYRGILLDWINGLVLPPNANILELGCGPGNLSAELVKMNHNVTGADKSKHMIRRASKINTTAKFVHADALRLPLNDNEFDIVLLASLINVVPDRVRLLEEIQRVLKPEGMVTVLFPTPEFDAKSAEKISASLNLRPISTAAISVWASVGKKLLPIDICGEFSKAGFKVLRTDLHFGNNIASVTADNTGSP